MRMVEKVALAIDDAVMRYIIAHEIKARKDPTLKPCVGRADVPSDVIARAAVETMRVPDDDVLLAMAEVLRSCDNYMGWDRDASEYVEDAKRACAAMIDKAIQESGE